MKLSGLTGQGSRPRVKGHAFRAWQLVMGGFSAAFAVMLLGDDLGDFLPRDQVRALRQGRPPDRPVGESVDARDDSWRGRFGEQWFLLPNPSYGSWEAALAGCRDPDRESPACYAERLEGKYRMLIPAAPPPRPAE
jgi:hypothetical protein